MHKQHKKITIILILTLFLIPINIPLVQSQELVTIQGYVYLDLEKIKPSEVSLILPDEPKYAFVLSDGKYDFMFTYDEPTKGSFRVIYQAVQYTPIETIAIEESGEGEGSQSDP